MPQTDQRLSCNSIRRRRLGIIWLLRLLLRLLPLLVPLLLMAGATTVQGGGCVTCRCNRAVPIISISTLRRTRGW